MKTRVKQERTRDRENKKEISKDRRVKQKDNDSAKEKKSEAINKKGV